MALNPSTPHGQAAVGSRPRQLTSPKAAVAAAHASETMAGAALRAETPASALREWNADPGSVALIPSEPRHANRSRQLPRRYLLLARHRERRVPASRPRPEPYQITKRLDQEQVQSARQKKRLDTRLTERRRSRYERMRNN
jgi:hypothetical protein